MTRMTSGILSAALIAVALFGVAPAAGAQQRDTTVAAAPGRTITLKGAPRRSKSSTKADAREAAKRPHDPRFRPAGAARQATARRTPAAAPGTPRVNKRPKSASAPDTTGPQR